MFLLNITSKIARYLSIRAYHCYPLNRKNVANQTQNFIKKKFNWTKVFVQFLHKLYHHHNLYRYFQALVVENKTNVKIYFIIKSSKIPARFMPILPSMEKMTNSERSQELLEISKLQTKDHLAEVCDKRPKEQKQLSSRARWRLWL